jgi:uncharacterized protein (DUF927 family)
LAEYVLDDALLVAGGVAMMAAADLSPKEWLNHRFNKLSELNDGEKISLDSEFIDLILINPDLDIHVNTDPNQLIHPAPYYKRLFTLLHVLETDEIEKITSTYFNGSYWESLPRNRRTEIINKVKSEYADPEVIDHHEWKGVKVPDGFVLEDKFIGQRKVNNRTGDVFYVPFCRSPSIVTAIGTNIDDGKYWTEVTFKNMFGFECIEWLPQQDALSRKGVMALSSKGCNLIEQHASIMNDYIGACISTNSDSLEQKIVTEKNGWKLNNSLFAFGNRGFSADGNVNIIPLRAKAVDGLQPCGTLEGWVDAVSNLLKFSQLRFKFYAVAAAPLLRILGVQSFILDHNGETSLGKTKGFDAAISMFGNPDQLRFNGDTTKTAAEVLAETHTDLPLYLDETGTQQNDEVLKTIVYMLANEQGRMRGQKDGGLRETGTWKTVALTTGERPLTSSKSFSGQFVRVIEIRGTLGANLGTEIKNMGDGIKQNYGHLGELYFDKIFEYMPKLKDFYNIARQRLANTHTNTGDRLADSFAAIMVAGILLEEVFSEIGIEPIKPHTVVDEYFEKCVYNAPIESYSDRALHVIMDWVNSKNKSFCDANNPIDKGSPDFYGWINTEYLDAIPSEVNKVLDKAGFDSVRSRNDWKDEGIIICNEPRKDYTAKHNGKTSKVIRFDLVNIKKKLGLDIID